MPRKAWKMPPVPTGYVTKAQTRAILPQEDLEDDVAPLTPEQIISDHSSHNISDFTPHLGPARVIFLFYGGRRRPGDVADHAERQIPTAARAGIQLCVAVVDIVHGSHHDISRGAATFWLPQFIGGRVGAFGAAPPCETWSVTRWIEYAQALLEQSPQAAEELHNRKHPVPLRTAAHPWGRTDLTPKEHRQVRTANVLLTYTIAFATLAFF